MKCEVKNVQSAEVFTIPPEGMIFGRSGGPANITVADQSVSKRHARIFCKDGQWLLEDLKSVNGTVVNNRRITEPVALTPGFVFALSKHQFEIVSVDGVAGSGGRSRNGVNGNGNGESDPRRGRASSSGQSSAQMPARSARGGPSGQPVPVPDAEPMLPPEPSRSRSMAPMGEPSEFQQDQQANDPYMDELQGGDGGGGAGAAAVFAALPKAIAYYLANVPLMALNPIGTVKKGVENPKVKAMGPLELIAFFLPVMLFSFVIKAWAAGLATLISGGGFSFMSFVPIVPLIIAVVASVIGGFLTHPLTKLFVERIAKGETDEKTRTNAAIMGTTASALVAIPQALAVFLTGVVATLAAHFGPAGLLLIIPGVLMAITTPLSPYIGWQWAKAWRCASWAQTVMMVVTILAALGGVAGCVGTVLDGIHLWRGGGTAVIDPNLSDEAKKALEDAQKAADDAKKAADDAGKKVDDDSGKKADDSGKKADDDSGKKADDSGKKADDDSGKKAADDNGGKKPDDGGKKVEPVAAPSGDFATYHEHRTEIERRLEANPLLIKDGNRTQLSRFGQAYMQLLKNEKDVRQDARGELASKKRGKPDYSSLPDQKVVDRYVEAALYQKTAREVEAVYALLPKE